MPYSRPRNYGHKQSLQIPSSPISGWKLYHVSNVVYAQETKKLKAMASKCPSKSNESPLDVGHPDIRTKVVQLIYGYKINGAKYTNKNDESSIKPEI